MTQKLKELKIRNKTVNQLFDEYMAVKKIADTTRVNYLRIWNLYIMESVGTMKVTQVTQIAIKGLYSDMAKKNLKSSTIKLAHNLLNPAFEMAIDNDFIRKNPCQKCLPGAIPL